MFDKVVKLTVNQRVQGMSVEQANFRDLLLRLRRGESTVEDWELLLTRQPSSVPNLSEFENATRLFYSNEQVANYNHEQLTKLEHPVAHINARYSSVIAKTISSEDMSELEPVVFLAKHATVMLTMNCTCLVHCHVNLVAKKGTLPQRYAYFDQEPLYDVYVIYHFTYNFISW